MKLKIARTVCFMFTVACAVYMRPTMITEASPSTHTKPELSQNKPAPQSPNDNCQIFGVNLNGGEFFVPDRQRYPGVYGEDYIYPGTNFCPNQYECYNNAWELDYYHSKGLNLMRFVVKWERMQPELYGPLSTFDTGMVDQALANAAARGMKLIIDSHDAARREVDGTEYSIGSPEVSYDAFSDYWQKMAAHFQGKAGIFGYALSSEPHDMEGLWVTDGAQAGVDGVRRSDLQTAIIVPGDGWSGAHTWVANGNDPLRNLSDPTHNLIFEAHQYFDYDEGGVYELPYDYLPAYPTIGVDYARPFVNWLRQYHLKGIIGEYGVPDDDPRWLPVLDNFLGYLQSSSDVIMGGTYWAGGPWWHSYPLSVEPQNGQDRPQIDILQQHPSTCSGPITGCGGGAFIDVCPQDYFFAAVTYLTDNGVIAGYPDGTFRPYSNISRAQLCKIIVLAEGLPIDISSGPHFSDVPPGSTFYPYVETARNNSIVAGYDDGTFKPGNTLTRGQQSKAVALASGWDLINPAMPTFSDVSRGNVFYNYIETAYCHGIINGYSDGSFRPANNATRGQLAKIVYESLVGGRSCP